MIIQRDIPPVDELHSRLAESELAVADLPGLGSGLGTESMIYVAAVLVVLTLIGMASGRAPAVLVLGCSLAIAGLLRIAPASALFSGLSNGGVITVAAMLVIAKGIV